MTKGLKILFFAHAVFNGIGAMLLFFGTGILNNLVGLSSEANFVWHLLGACSLSLAFLSFFVTKFKEKIAVLSVALVFVIFHFVSAIVSLIIVFTSNKVIIANTVVHLIFLLLFAVFVMRYVNSYKQKP